MSLLIDLPCRRNFHVIIFLLLDLEKMPILLTLPNVLRDNSTKFPALSFNGVSEIAMIKINARAFVFGRRCHSKVHVVNAIFSP